MKAVIDSNIFVMCMNPLSRYHLIFTNLVRGDYKLCVTTEITFEYLEVFQRKFSSQKSEMLYKFLHESNHVIDFDVFFKWNLITVDTDDNKYVDCYIASGADYLVTNDGHFAVLKEISFPPVKCINIDEFLALIA